MSYYNKSRQEIHELDVASKDARTKLMESMVLEARNLDEKDVAMLRKETADSLVVAKGYADKVSNEKTSHLHARRAHRQGGGGQGRRRRPGESGGQGVGSEKRW